MAVDGPLELLSIDEAGRALRAGTLSPVDLTRACLARIEALNPSLNAYITVTGDSALAEAGQAGREIAAGRWRGPLHGIPVALKDLIDTAGVRTTAASALYEGRIPTEDAAVVERLRVAGAVLLGKHNLHEFAYGASSVASHFGPVANPWDPASIAGGSSGGSAAAVSAGLCFAALGSDTGGSIRQPSALCGTVGLKPTYGRVSNRGVIPLVWSMDHVGPITRTANDAALVLQAIAGFDPLDVASANRPVGRYFDQDPPRDGGVRIGLPRGFFFADLEREVGNAIEAALGVLERLGARLKDVVLDGRADRTVFRAEAYSWHARSIEQSPQCYQPETLAKLSIGEKIDTPTYIRARRELDELRRSIEECFDAVDLLVVPTTPVAAPKIADYPPTFQGVLALEGLLMRNTRLFSTAGLPAISIPCGFSSTGLPIGLQICGAPWAERRVLDLARRFEAATDWHCRRPPLATQS